MLLNFIFRSIVFGVFLVLGAASESLAQSKEVVVIGTVHGDHNRFPLYNFQTLEIVLKHINPDLLLIEEDPQWFHENRFETMSEEQYGAARPVEIKKVLMPFAKAKVVKVIPTDWRMDFDRESAKNAEAEKALLKDPRNKALYATLIKSYEALFIDDYLTKSIYDLHSDTMMAVLEQRDELFTGTPFEKLRQLDRERQRHINENVVHALATEKFQRAVVVYGISHRPFIVRAIKKSKAANVLSLQEAMKPRVPSFFDREKSLMIPE